MSKVELTVAPNYVSSWGLWEAVRELFQNAIDQQTQNPENVWSWEYDPTAEKLTISNKTSVLSMNSLLLGGTTKSDDGKTIGQFGEGYKIATLVLTRLDKGIIFYNYGAREVWKPRFVKSKRFESYVLTFFIDKKPIWEKVPSNDLTIEVSDLSPDEWLEIRDKILPCNSHYQVVETTEWGEIIDQPHKVYVNGLYVCDHTPYEYGYNFITGLVKLDRDRKLVSDFELSWTASKLWGKTNSSKCLELITKGAADVAYLHNTGGHYYWSRNAYNEFLTKYGDKAVPCDSQGELEKVPKGYKGIMVSTNYASLVRSCADYVSPIEDDEDLFETMENWLDSLADDITEAQMKLGKNLLDRLREEYE